MLEIDGLTAEHIGTIAWQHQIPIFELTVQQASLEEAFMTLTSDSVEYRSTDTTGTATTTPRRWRHDHHPRPDAASTARGTRLRVTQPRVVLSEWTKFRSLRSTVYTLLIAVVLMIGLGAMFAAITANQPGGFEPGATAISTIADRHVLRAAGHRRARACC